MLLNVIVAVQDARLRSRLLKALNRKDVLTNEVADEKNFWKHIGNKACDVIILSHAFLPGTIPEELKTIKDLPEKPIVAIMSDAGADEERAELLAAGFDVILPIQHINRPLGQFVSSVLERRQRSIDRAFPVGPDAPEPFLDSFVANSVAMNSFLRLARQVVRSDSTVLILGETGVGKERLARALHNEGKRSDKPFIVVNCGALPEGLLESELFGHEEGAFTGATRVRRGCFELAHSGTIFLDEIGEMPLHLQVKLLRVLDSREMQRIGSERLMAVDLRIIAATNRDLAEQVRDKGFRKDLYYRLNVVTLEIPPLRERLEDIPELARTYLAYQAPRIGCDVTEISERAMRMLRDYDWPGNVRELFNILERAILLCESDTIDLSDLSLEISKEQRFSHTFHGSGRDETTNVPLPGDWLNTPLKELRQQVFQQIEHQYIREVLVNSKGRIAQAAQQCGLNERALYTKMRQYHLRKEDFK